MVMEITQFLVAALSADAGVRTGAEGSLRQCQEQHLPHFLLSLSLELANDDKPLESRRLAAILLINSLDAKQWTALDTVIKSQVKDLLLATLASSSLEASHTSAHVIAKVASVDIPLKQWPQLVKSLLSNMTDHASPATLKQSTLLTLGYVCEEVSHEDLEQEDVNSVFQAIYYGTVPYETNTPAVHLAAIKALLHALDIAQVNFENRDYTTFIMNTLFKAARSHEAETRHAAFECLVSIASIYYEVLDSYIHSIYNLTSVAINGDEESVALQAVEFWSSICDVEIELQEFVNPDPNDWSPPHSGFIKWALSDLVPVLLETLLKQDQGGDDDVRNISMACGNCLGLVVRTVGDDIVPCVRRFVEAKISEPQWSSREAAICDLRSIFQRPTFVKLDPLVYGALKFSLKQLLDAIV